MSTLHDNLKCDTKHWITVKKRINIGFAKPTPLLEVARLRRCYLQNFKLLKTYVNNIQQT